MSLALTIDFADGRRCPVRIGRGALAELPEVWRGDWREAAVVGDATVIRLFGERVAGLLSPLLAGAARPLLLDFPPGEASKTRETKAALEDRLLEAGLSRRSCIVALGGGLSLDVAGFVAATYLRGVACLNIPTSLLAQVDACLGGKTGVNTPHGKNLVGAFHQPAAVLVDQELLGSLAAPEWRNGLAEIVKHAVIADASLLDWLAAAAPALRQPGPLEDHPIRRCLEIKAALVSADERESGPRAHLNFGHTIGHALEHALEHRLAHGAAVAAGMVVEARLAALLCGFPVGELARLEQLLAALGLPVGPPPGLAFDALCPFLRLDKKRDAAELRLALPRRIGEMAGGAAGTIAATLPDLRRAYEESTCSA